MNYNVNINVTTSLRDPNRWLAVLESKIETDTVTIIEREYPRDWNKADVATFFLEFVLGNLNWS